MKRVVFKLLVLVSFWGLVKIGSTNAYFSGQSVVESNVFTAGDWTAPESWVTQITGSGEIFGLTTLTEFTVHYEAEDDGGIDFVELWYSFNGGDWQYYGQDVPNSPGSFLFDCPEGDGIYEFKTIAFDTFGNEEGKEADFIPLMIEVDSQPPTSNLSLNDIGLEKWFGQNLLGNGGFEDGEDGWQSGGDGDHWVVDYGEDGDGYSISPTEGGYMYALGFHDYLPVEDGRDWLMREVSLPDNLCSSLSFDWRAISEDTVDYDWFSVWLGNENDEVLETILSTGSNEVDLVGWGDTFNWSIDSGWRQVTHSLLNYAGKTIKVWFEVTNTEDDFGSTWAYLDNVVISTADNRITEDQPVNFDGHDASGSGLLAVDYEVDEGGEESAEGDDLYLEAGDHQIDSQAEDSAGNEEEEGTDHLVVLPDIVLNRFSAAPGQGDEWVEVFNNSDSDIDLAGWEICDTYSTEHCQELTETNSDNQSTVLFSGDSLRFNDNFFLNNGGDKLVLRNDLGEEIDSFEYPDFDGYHDLVWERNPDGIGSWGMANSPDIGVNVVSRYSEANRILLTVYNLPENYGEGELIDYEITYDDGSGEKGIYGTILAEVVEEHRADRELYLGSCSWGGCTPDSVPGGFVEVSLMENGITIVGLKEFDI